MDPLPDGWECLAEPPKNFVVQPGKTVTVRMDAVEFRSLEVPEDLTVKICNPADVSCQEPRAENITPGPDGFLEFEVPHGFSGFLVFEAPNMVPSLLFNNMPWIENLNTSGPSLATPATLDDIYERAGRPTMENTGVAILEVRNCDDNSGPGVSFDPLADGNEPFYFDGTQPTRARTTTINSTLLAPRRENRAVAGFSNVPAGFQTFVMRLPDTDYTVSFTMQIRANWITYARLFPQWRSE